MLSFGNAILIVFILIRLLIAAGLFYLVIVEVRKIKKRNVKGEDKGVRKDADTKGTDGSLDSRD